MKRTIYITLITVLATGCSMIFDMEEILLTRSDISLTFRGGLEISYNPDTHQLGYNESRNEYRVYDDRISNWFILTCSAKPVSVGQSVTADISWTGRTGTKSIDDIIFMVEKTDEDGMVWLWNTSHSLGVVIRNL